SGLNQTLRDAYVGFRRLFILSLCKLPAAFLYVSFASDPTEVWGLLFTFGFGFGEVLLGLHAFRDFFVGLTDLSAGDDSQDVLSSPLYVGLTEVKLLTYLFVIAKAVLTVLPELTTLSSDEYGIVTATGIVSFAGYRMLFTAVAVVISLLIGIVWYIRIFRYVRILSKDADFNENLNTRYNQEVLSNKSLLDRSRIFLSLSILSVAAVFSLEFKFDGFNYLPHAVFLTMMLIAILMLRSAYPKEAGKCGKICLVNLVASVAVWIYTFLFIQSFYGTILSDTDEGAAFTVSEVLELRMRRDFGIIYGYLGMVAAAAVEAVLFILLLLFLRKLILPIIRDHTGGTLAPDGHIIGGNPEKNTLPTRRILDAVIIVGAVSSLSGVVHAALLPYLPAYWIADFILRLVYLSLSLYLYSRIRYEMKDRYDLG
ncbi:MAG: hypothetical protein ACI3YK_07845, partial [Eubacteriales bacterium]